MVSSSVKDAFSKGFDAVRESDTFSSCLALFKKEKPSVLAVLDDKGRYKGVIARRWIVRSRLEPAKTKAEKLMRPAPTVGLHDSISRVARLMIESGIMQLPVFSGKKLQGFITNEDVIHSAAAEQWGGTKVEEIMTKKIFVVEEKESVGALLSLFREHGISHAPVVRDAKLVGIVSVHDIIEHIFQPRQRQSRGEIVGEKTPVLSIPVKGIMTEPVITILPETIIRDAANKMHEFNISSLIVVRSGRPAGIVTKKDFLEPISQIEKTGRGVVIQFSVKDIDINELKQGFIMDDFESFARKYSKTLESATLFVYLKSHGTNYKKDQLVHCRLQLRAPRISASFFSSSEGWGVEKTFHVALDRLERQILRSKEFEHKPEFAKTYLRRIRFPLSEL